MKLEYRTVGGALFLVGSVQFLLVLVMVEALHPGYSVSENYISDLGVGTTSLIFNSSVFLLGLLALTGVYFVKFVFESKTMLALLVLAGIGAMGVGLFPKTAGDIHSVFSFFAFLFSGLSAIVSYKVTRPPLSFFYVLLGLVSLVAMVLFASGVYLGLGKGGMERMIADPVLFWGVAFGSHLMTRSKDAK